MQLKLLLFQLSNVSFPLSFSIGLLIIFMFSLKLCQTNANIYQYLVCFTRMREDYRGRLTLKNYVRVTHRRWCDFYYFRQPNKICGIIICFKEVSNISPIEQKSEILQGCRLELMKSSRNWMRIFSFVNLLRFDQFFKLQKRVSK